jgi:oligopeptide transport system substrate-binding protein
LKYESGTVDWLSEVSPEIAPDLIRMHREDLRLFPGFGTYFYSVNCNPRLPDGKDNPFHDVRVRQAFAMSIDKIPIVKSITRLGQPIATTFIPPGAFPHYVLPTGLPYDVARARKLLADAGYPGGAGFPRVSILFNNETTDHKFIAQNIRKQWADALGVNVDLEGIEINTFRSRLHDKSYSLARAAWTGDYNDPSTFTDKYLSSSENNDSAWSNARYDALCEKATHERDPLARLKILHDAEQILCDQAPIIPLYHYVNTYMFRDDVKGIPLNPRQTTLFKAFESARNGASAKK